MIEKYIIIIAVVIVAASVLFPTHNALAVISVFWQGTLPGAGISYTTNDGGVNSGTIVEVNVTDTTPGLYAGNGIIDHINVIVNSTSDPAGIPLTLTEDAGDTGHFGNTNLIFTDGSQLYSQSSSQTAGIDQPSSNLDPNAIETVIGNSTSGILVFSSSDSVTGIFLNSTETGKNTGIFTSPLHFTSGPSVNGSSIQVKGGDIVSILNVFTFNFENELVTPNPNPGLGALPAKFGDTLSIVYNGIKDDASISSGFGPGGGGGGLIRPSLVLDVVASVGGSPYVVSPPSFGGSFSDGLTLIKGNTKTTFDTSKFNQEIPNQVMVKGEPVNMKFKTYEAYKKDGVIGMTLFFIPRGKDLNMDVGNSIASIEWKNGKPVDIDDSSHILSDVKATSDNDGKFQYTQFSFTPTKSYDKMSFLVRAWNDHLYTKTMRVHDAVDVVQPQKTLPPGVVKYENFADLQDTLYKDKFYKPEIMAHIHDTNAVFPDLQGKVYWLYDTTEHSVTLVISDTEDNELFKYNALLQPFEKEKKGDYKFMKFTVEQLNRQNKEQIQHAIEVEISKAMSLELKNGLVRQSKW